MQSSSSSISSQQFSLFSTSSNEKKSEIPNLIRSARNAFLDLEQKDMNVLQGLVKVFTKKVNNKTYRVFGLKKEDQSKIDFKKLRAELSNELGFKETKPFSQIIGDSIHFSKQGSQECRKVFAESVKNDNESIMLYGYTGNRSSDNSLIDANQAVNEWLDQSADNSKRVIANVVDEHFVVAIEKWGCSISENISNLFLIYSDGQTPSVKFGDDVTLSDGLTNEKVICFDGGIQSLRQIINMLRNDISVVGLQELRDLSLEKHIEPSSKQPYLSAIGFLNCIKNKDVQSAEEAKECISEYFKSYAITNMKAKDACTKKALLTAAVDDFIKYEIWKKLKLVKTIDNKQSQTLSPKL